MSLAGRVLNRYGSAHGSTWATSVAWNLLFSFFPIVLLVLEVGTAIFAGGTAVANVDHQITTIFPGTSGVLLVDTINGFRHPSGILVLVTVVGYLWSGSSLFSSLESAFAAMHDAPSRSFFASKLRAVVMIVVFAALMVVAVATSTLLAIAGRLHHPPFFLHSGVGAVVVQCVVGIFDFGILAAVIYYLVPKDRPPIRRVVVTAVTVGCAMELLTLCFPLYLDLQHGFSAYGTTFALFFLVMTYAYFLAQIVVIGSALLAELWHPTAAQEGASDVTSRTPRVRTKDRPVPKSTATLHGPARGHKKKPRRH